MYSKPLLNSLSILLIKENFGNLQMQYDTPDTPDEPTETTVSIEADDADWILYNNYEQRYMLGSEFESEYALVVGIGGEGDRCRSLVGFDISELVGKTIVSATLKIYQVQTNGSPYGDSGIGSIIVDHVDFGTIEGTSSEFNEYLSENIGTISEDSTAEWKTLAVTDEVETDLSASRSSSCFKLRFTDEDISKEMYFTLFEDESGTGGTTNYPTLEVTYTE